ncbi:MAG: hypothetical protein COT85_08080 [Chlamydiae bacterium CG10_big_fil_rev_8_21_14_0_10_42_34]|nr:MAG: hypothetical protein COT85_08080 [Chlamydiae bacterium CG10_big_fil_rev_8_21_14_0_10_42_34]
MSTLPGVTLSFQSLISAYKRIQDQLVKQVRALASKMSQANPGSFILLQFQMSQVTQMGESISNLISQVNSVINSAIRNQKVQ